LYSVRPDTWTTLSLFFAFVAFAAMAMDHLWWGILLFAVSSSCALFCFALYAGSVSAGESTS